MQLAAAVRPVGGEQSRLEAEVGQGVIGAQGNAKNASAVAVESARHVERQPWAGQRIGKLEPARFLATDIAHQTDAEQAVDDQAEALPRRNVCVHPAAGLKPGLPGVCGIHRQTGGIGTAHDHQGDPLRRQPARGDQGIATVVAGAGEDQDRLAGLAGQHQGEFGSCSACPFHQRRIGMRVGPLAVDRPYVGGHEQRRRDEGKRIGQHGRRSRTGRVWSTMKFFIFDIEGVGYAGRTS
jgi:hypothetical protein